MVPGRRNRVLLYASRTGSYRGQCAEFCGFQHANMGLYVVAQPAAAFRSWLAGMAAPASAPTDSTERAGDRLFLASQCASCHQIRGTSADATVGPDLTHLATRAMLAAATIPNDLAHLEAWISGPQSIKPGSRMPDLGLPRSQVAEIAASELAQDVFLSPGDAGRFFAAAVEARALPPFAVVYATSRFTHALRYDLTETKRLLGWEPTERWATGANPG